MDNKDFTPEQRAQWIDMLCDRNEEVTIVTKVARGLYLAQLDKGFFSEDGDIFTSFLVINSDHLYPIAN